MTSGPLLQAFVTQAPDPAASSSVLLDSLGRAGPIGILVLTLLALFSVASWAIIAYKLLYLRQAKRQSVRFLDTFWSSKRLDAIFKSTEQLRSPVAQVFRAGYIELAKLKKRRESAEERGADQPSDTQLGDRDNIERALRRAALTELTMLEAQLPFLATVGSTAPFIGLFGTVWGIMNSFAEIGRLGNANLATVAPGISEALIATAAGLAAAIPAVMAFNYLNNQIKLLDTEMQNFTSDFLNIVERHFF